jgi:hypothetical protein
MTNSPHDGLDATDDGELSDEMLTDLNGGAVVGITIIP